MEISKSSEYKKYKKSQKSLKYQKYYKSKKSMKCVGSWKDEGYQNTGSRRNTWASLNIRDCSYPFRISRRKNPKSQTIDGNYRFPSFSRWQLSFDRSGVACDRNLSAMQCNETGQQPGARVRGIRGPR